MEIGLDFIELDASTESDLTQANRLDLDRERHDRVCGWWLGKRGRNFHGAEHFEVQECLDRRIDLRGREGGSFANVDGASQGRFRYLLLARSLAVRIEAGDGDRPKGRSGTGQHLEAVVGYVFADIDLGVGLDRRIGVSPIGERFLYCVLA